MSEQLQYGLPFCETHQQQFERWKELPGSRQILRQCYRVAAQYGRRYVRTKRKVSMKLIYELVRDQVQAVRARCKRRGIDIKQWQGYAMPNAFTAYVARHIEAHRPEWQGMFRKSAIGREPKRKRVIVIEERRSA